MVDLRSVREGMQVLGSDGGMIGEVSGVHGNHIHVRPTPPVEGGAEHVVPLAWVARVDDHVHLQRTAALARDTWQSHEGGGGTAGAAAAQRRGEAATDRPARGSKWVWIVGAIMLLIIIILGIRAFGYAGTEPDYENGVAAADAPDA